MGNACDGHSKELPPTWKKTKNKTLSNGRIFRSLGSDSKKTLQTHQAQSIWGLLDDHFSSLNHEQRVAFQGEDGWWTKQFVERTLWNLGFFKLNLCVFLACWIGLVWDGTATSPVYNGILPWHQIAATKKGQLVTRNYPDSLIVLECFFFQPLRIHVWFIYLHGQHEGKFSRNRRPVEGCRLSHHSQGLPTNI